MDFLSFWEGRVTLCADERCGTALLNLFMDHAIPYDGFTVCGDCVRFTISARNAERVLALCKPMGICLSVVERRGFPQAWRRYGRRVGMWLGGIVAASLIFAASRVVWDIRITGNEQLEAREIEAMLKESGLSVGTYLPTLDTDLVENRLLLAHREIGWISVNIKGTTANVEIVETVRGGTAQTEAANLIATRDGRIERVEAYDGNVCVKVGDVVREGQVLVSGVYEGSGGLRSTRATGAIYARTVRDFMIEIPLQCTKKVYTGREWREKYINFFSNRIKVFANTGNVGGTCDIIYYNGSLQLPGGVTVPMGTETVCYREYHEESVTLDGQSAMEKAFSALEHQLEAFVTETDAELLRKTVEWELDETAYHLRCTVICIENIALTQEIDID